MNLPQRHRAAEEGRQGDKERGRQGEAAPSPLSSVLRAYVVLWLRVSVADCNCHRRRANGRRKKRKEREEEEDQYVRRLARSEGSGLRAPRASGIRRGVDAH